MLFGVQTTFVVTMLLLLIFKRYFFLLRFPMIINLVAACERNIGKEKEYFFSVQILF